MITAGKRSSKPFAQKSRLPLAIVDTFSYLGCRITVRSTAVATGGIEGSYEIVAAAAGTAAVFGDRNIGRLCSEWMEAPSRSYLLEMAKCEIDFALETPY